MYRPPAYPVHSTFKIHWEFTTFHHFHTPVSHHHVLPELQQHPIINPLPRPLPVSILEAQRSELEGQDPGKRTARGCRRETVINDEVSARGLEKVKSKSRVRKGRTACPSQPLGSDVVEWRVEKVWVTLPHEHQRGWWPQVSGSLWHGWSWHTPLWRISYDTETFENHLTASCL